MRKAREIGLDYGEPVRIACDSKYWLWVNGRLAVFEGQLKRGPTPSDTYYDEVDLAPHLRAGSNTLVVLVWYCGKHGFSHNSSGKAGLVLDAGAGGGDLCSDTSWRVTGY
jgi:alpha-L-rhamnosidase